MACLLLAACQSNPFAWSKAGGERIDDTLEQAKTSARQQAGQVPPEVSQALLPPIQVRLPEGGSAPLERRFDLAVSNAPARQVFLGLVEGTPYSMVVHPEVGGVLSLNLKAVTVDEALKAIRQVYGYEYRREGNRYFILGPGMQLRIFAVNYLNLSRKGKSDTRVASGELSKSTTGGGGGAGGTSTSSRLPSIQVETDSQADFWKDLRDTLTTIVGTEGGRQVVVNPHGGHVIVRAMPDELRVVEEFLGLTHAAVNRQVILEAKVINVQLKDGYQTGINWATLQGSSVIGQTGGGSVFSGSGTIFDGPGLSEIAGNTGNLTGPLNPGALAGALPSGTGTSAFGGVFSWAVAASNFHAFVELLKTQGDVQVLSSPRVSTINNQKAVIKVGGDEFFITGITSTPYTDAAGRTVLSNEVELAPFFSGIALDVTPQIDERNQITLHIHPAVSEVAERSKTFTVSGQISTLPLAVSAVQESDNVVRAASGQIIVIGGLMKEVSTDDNAGLPLLGDIPLAGHLFKHKRITRVKNELVILLKPTIVELGNAELWADSIQGTQERIQQLRRQP